jgi:rhamnose utilization protein RhaD (predicted bifunctional aldolase and dehydrogenase)
MSRIDPLNPAGEIQPSEEAAARAELRAMGQALGGLRWVQGPGGNCSVKVGSQLWVKASGTRFADVADDGGHARVSTDLALKALAGDAEADKELFARTPRPSLETYFHALGPKIVAHTHSLGALLFACSKPDYFRSIHDGYVQIPYVRPGRGVAEAMQGVLGFSGDDVGERVCILRSHGIVAYADSARRAIELTTRFDDRVRALAEKDGKLDDIVPQVEAYLAADERAVEGGFYRALPTRTARETDPPLYLFPDAPVCASAVLVDSLSDASAAAASAIAQVGRACVLVDPSGKRIAVAKSQNQLQQTCEVAAAHDWLEDALRQRGIANYLAADEPARILSMPSEQYRMRLAAKTS